MNSSCCGKYHASKLASYPLHIENNNGNTPPVMLALLIGSWNVKLSNSLEAEKDPLPWSKVCDALKTCNVDSSTTDISHIPCAYTQVDVVDVDVVLQRKKPKQVIQTDTLVC